MNSYFDHSCFLIFLFFAKFGCKVTKIATDFTDFSLRLLLICVNPSALLRNLSNFAAEMANAYFQFRQFTIRQDCCAMKVGTDGTLLGAWASVPQGNSRVLDIGTGTGLIALMLAQRFPNAEIMGIDIDADAVRQARENVAASPFAARVTISEADVRQMDSPECFDAIVSNPPYFVDSLTCPDQQRTTARHTATLTYAQLMAAAFRQLRPEGIFSVVIPTDSLPQLEAEARLCGFFPSRICKVRTTPTKHPKRCLIEFRKVPVAKIDASEGIIESKPGERSPWYHELTQDFYIK